MAKIVGVTYRDGGIYAVTVDSVEGRQKFVLERHGRWVAQDETLTRFMCSECKSKNHRGGDDYCSACGALMDL